MTHEHRVRYHETDAQGFLFNSRYLELADVAMTEFFRDLGWTYRELNDQGLDPSVVSAHLTFLAPVRFDDVVHVEVRCIRVGQSSFVLDMSFRRDGTAVAGAEITYVNVDAEAAHSVALPSAVTVRLRSVADRATDLRDSHQEPARRS